MIRKILLIAIIILGAGLRLYDFGNVPPSPNWDEVSLGYNAYSILETGRDEYGEFLPLVLRSYDDYKPALYSYLVIPLLPIFGLSTFAVRLPSALAGIALIPLVYYLVKELFTKISIKKKNATEPVALVSAFMTAISPWSIQFSRQAFESNVGVTINVLAAVLFLKGLNNKYLLPISFAVAASNIHMYQSNRVFTPLLMAALVLIFYKSLLKVKKITALSFGAALLVALPFIVYTFTNQNALLRAKGVSVFSDQTNVLKENAEKYLISKQENNYLGIVLDNRRIEYAKLVADGYLSHFDINWMFIEGDIARHHAPYMGLLYIISLPFLFIGLYQVAFSKTEKKKRLVLFTFLLIAPIPASITTGVPHAVRTLNLVPVLQIALGFGFVASYIYIRNWFQRGILVKIVLLFSLGVFAVLSILNFLYYLNQYFVQLSIQTSDSWQYGYEEAVKFTEENQKNFSQIIVDNRAPLDQSYMFFLFFSRFDPEEYQKLGGTESGGFRETHRGFKNYTFRPVDINKEEEGNLLLMRPQDVPAGSQVIKRVDYLDGEPAIFFVEK